MWYLNWWNGPSCARASAQRNVVASVGPRFASLRRFPNPSDWRDVGLAAGLFAFVAHPLACRSGLITGFRWPGLGAALALLGRTLVMPALTEELLFRGLLNPPLGQATRPARFGWGVGSLAVYVISHPLLAWLFRPSAPPIFTSLTFLLLTALLGFLCLMLYLRSGSLWGAVVLHAAAVTGWGLLGGLEQLQT